MQKRLKRCYGQKDLHFLTFCCYHRRRYLQTAYAKNLFLKILAQVRSQFRFSLVGYVLMPEHVHLLISEPTSGTPSSVLQILKQNASRTLRRKRKISRAQLPLPFCPAESPPAFWQRRFYDFNVWSGKKLKEKLDYMHRNPVQRQLASHPKDWPWCSWSHYEKGEQGLIRIDRIEDKSDNTQSTAARKSQEPHP